MIISKTPLRISFVGGGTDFEDFYKKHSGQVLSTSINKYVYLAVNPKFDGQIRVSYSKTENVAHRNEIEHSIVRAALEHTDIEKGLEIVSVGDIPSKGTGLGSSSSFTVGLLHSLHAHLGKKISAQELAEKACQIEIEKLKSPIGKQDQYIAAFGGLNVTTFHKNGTVSVEPVSLPKKTKENFKKHLLAFYTSTERSAQDVLSEQHNNIPKKFKTLKKISDLVIPFKESLEKRDFKKAGTILHQNWVLKKELASGISSAKIDSMYQAALKAGAFGGKILGAGGGGFLLVIADPKKHTHIKKALGDYRVFDFDFSTEGSQIIFNG